MRENGNVELLAQDPSEVARLMLEQLGDQVKRERVRPEHYDPALVYSPTSRHSFYRDCVLARLGRADMGIYRRLSEHAQQMERASAARDGDRARRLATGGFETRITPDRTQGYGGYLSPPLWLNQLFATANRPGRVLAGLMTRFPLPLEVGEIALPTLSTGTQVAPAIDDEGVVDQDIVDAKAESTVVPLGGDADIALQLLEQSPPGAHMDWAMFMDLSEAYDENLEVELLEGTGTQNRTLLGAVNVPNITKVTATETSGRKLWIALSKLAAQVGDARKLPPECWLMRSARWFYFEGAEDTAERPFGLSTRFFLGNDDDTPDPISGMMGLPVFPNDAISATLGAGKNQDQIICLRPRNDGVFFEGDPQTMLADDYGGSATGTVRLQMHCNVAAITGRRPASIGVLQGAGLVVQTGY